MEKFEGISKFFKDVIKRSLCPFCKTQIRLEDFTDELSLHEFAVSGLCQDCQDDIFETKK